MLKELKISNFQSHKSSLLEFSSGINIISGQSNNGKTAILRSLNWVINNRPSGWSFKSNFANEKDKTEVSIIFNDCEIKRIRSNSKNQYLLKDNLYEALGNNVPDEIEKILNINELNFQNQLDKHFLLTDSPGEVGRTINQIVNLENIDKLTSIINTRINDTNKEIQFIKKENEDYYEKIKKYENIDKIEELTNNVINLYEKHNNKKDRLYSLNFIIDKINLNNLKINKLSKILSISNKIDIIDNLLIEIEDKRQSLKVIQAILNSLSKINRENPILINKIKISGQIDELMTYLDKQQRLNKKKKEIFSIISIIKDIKTSINKLNLKITEYDQEFIQILTQYGCPLCGKIN